MTGKRAITAAHVAGVRWVPLQRIALRDGGYVMHSKCVEFPDLVRVEEQTTAKHQLAVYYWVGDRRIDHAAGARQQIADALNELRGVTA